jgi:hypothetical protein
MKPLDILVILCIMLGSCSECIKAQILQKTGNQEVIRTGSLSVGNRDTTYGQGNTSGLYQPAGRTTDWKDLIGKPYFTFVAPTRNYFDIINNSTLFDNTRTSLTLKPVVQGFGITGTLNSKWAILNMKPGFPLYGDYHRSAKTSKSSFFDNFLYRAAGDVFNGYKDLTYPALSAPK